MRCANACSSTSSQKTSWVLWPYPPGRELSSIPSAKFAGIGGPSRAVRLETVNVTTEIASMNVEMLKLIALTLFLALLLAGSPPSSAADGGETTAKDVGKKMDETAL